MPDGADAPEAVDFKGLGVEVHAAGQKVIWTMIALAVVGAFGYFMYLHHTATVADDQRITEQLNEMIYILALPQEKRDKLQLDMPDSLRAKIRHPRGQDE